MHKKTWTAIELDQLAQALLQRHPGRNLERATEPYQVNLTDVEITVVAHAVISPARMSLRPPLDALKRDLAAAFKRLASKGSAVPGTAATASEQGAQGKQAQLPQVSLGPQKIFWTADEYLALGRHLQRDYPKAMEGHLPGLSIGDLSRAVQAVLPLNRRRRIANEAHITSFTRRLHDAISGRPIWTADQFVASGVLQPEPEAAKEDHRTGPRVKWSLDEWDALVRILHDLEPELEDNPDRLTLSRLNQAAGMMARPRKFFQASSPRKFLDDARARISMGPFRRAPAPIDPDQPPIVATLPERTPLPNPAIPADKLFSKVEWTREEWAAIARELHRLFPVMNYPRRGNLVGLDIHDVAFAQEKVLPLDRQRRHLKVASFSTVRAQLERAFADLNEELNAAAAPAASVPVATPAAAPLAAPAPAVAVAPPAPLPVVPSEPAPPATGPIDPYRAAFAPLVSLLASEVSNQLRPMLAAEVANHLRPMLTQFINEAVAIAVAAQAPATPPAAPAEAPKAPAEAASAPATPQASCVPITSAKNYGPDKPREDKPKRLTVGVLVNRASQYRAELEREFPQIDIKIGDVTMNNAAVSLANVDKAVCMTRFVDHVASRNLKKLAGDRYVDCNGGLSELKRIIGMWLKSLEAPAAPVTVPQKRA